MFDGSLIAEFIRQLQHAIANLLNNFLGPYFDWIYLIEWYVFGIGVIIACMVIGFFFNFKWVRFGLGMIVTHVIVALWAATRVFRHFRASRSDR